MATWEVIEQEGLRLVKCVLNNETVRTEAGAMYYMKGNIQMESKAPGVGGFLKGMLTGESIFRPTYTGSGELYLEPSFGNFHVMDCDDKGWILESGAYWASDSTIEVDVHREKAWASLKSGEGFANFQTKIKGAGKVVVAAPGPVQELRLNNERLVVDGKFVFARRGGVSFDVQRATKSLLGSATSGEGLVYVYEGTGTVLLSPMPFWRRRLFDSLHNAMMAMSAQKH